MIKCPNCGKRNSDENKFCGECGTDLSEAEMYCPSCGKKHNDGEKFCTECGTKLVTKIEYEILVMEKIEQEEEKRNAEIKELSESLDDISVIVLADELNISRWMYKSKETLLNEILIRVGSNEVIIMSKNLPTTKYEVYKLYYGLNDKTLRAIGRYYRCPMEYDKEMVRGEILEYMLNDTDLIGLKARINDYIEFYGYKYD